MLIFPDKIVRKAGLKLNAITKQRLCRQRRFLFWRRIESDDRALQVGKPSAPI